MVSIGTLHLYEASAGKSEQKVLRAHLDMIWRAEEMGFDSAWVAEHHFGEYGVCASPALILASAARVTKRIRLATGIITLPFNHPVRVAEEYAILDLLSDGRVDLGIGRGFQPIEFAGYGVNPMQSGEIFDEALHVIRSAWTSDRVTFAGNHYHLDGVEVRPRPLQRPHPPIWMAAVSEASFRKAGTLGLNLLCSPVFGDSVDRLASLVAQYRSAWQAAGRSPANGGRVALLCMVFVGKTMSTAAEAFRGPATWQFDSLFGYRAVGRSGTVTTGLETYARVRDQALVADWGDLVKRGAIVCGDSVYARERLGEMHDKVGFTDLLCWTRVGGLSDEDVVESMLRVIDDVAPSLA